MEIGFITNIGKVRAENQDRFLILKKIVETEEMLLCMVADGMGGTGNGGFASQTIKEQIQNWWKRTLPELLKKPEIHAYVSRSLNQNILQWNHMIYQQSKKLSISTGTTLSLLFAYQNQAVLKQIGDSRIYLERNGEWIQLTKDQTWEQQEIAKGKNPLLDKDFYKKKGALTNALGTAKSCQIVTQMMQMVYQDRYLLCSDGFYRYIDPEVDLKESDQKAQTVLEYMAEKIQNTSASDNFTAILINYTKSREDSQK